MDYKKFLESKKHSIGNAGFDPVYMPDMAFDFQKEIISRAVRKGRKAIGIELKDSYFKQAKLNLKHAENRFKNKVEQAKLF